VSNVMPGRLFQNETQRRRALRAAGVLALVLAARLPAAAATVDASIGVSVTVPERCILLTPARPLSPAEAAIAMARCPAADRVLLAPSPPQQSPVAEGVQAEPLVTVIF
jgi:hypothetical protein